MDKKPSSKLTSDLVPLQADIDRLTAQRQSLEQDLDRLDAILEALAGARPRYDALHDVCEALAKLDEQGGRKLFWGELPDTVDADEVMIRLGSLPEKHQQQIAGAMAKREALAKQLKQYRQELAWLDGQVDEAYQREQQRQEAFVIEREVPFFPMRVAVMPWARDSEDERYFRRALVIALLISVLLGGIVPLVTIPVVDRSDEIIEIPERIAKLVKTPPAVQEAEPVPEVAEEEPVEEEKPEEEPEPEEKPQPEESVREKVQSTGVLAFKETFKELIVDTPKVKRGSPTRVVEKAPTAAGDLPARRSLVAMQATGSSGGISADVVSRDIGAGGEGGGEKIGQVAFSRVESKVADMTAKQGQSLGGGGPAPGRTDEEIQIVFDRYKATLYRIYNKELRKDPTLRGNIILRITIEPDGAVSACKVDSTDLDSPPLVKKIVDRVLRFNFGPKKDVQKITIIYPIDFLPAR